MRQTIEFAGKEPNLAETNVTSLPAKQCRPSNSRVNIACEQFRKIRNTIVILGDFLQ